MTISDSLDGLAARGATQRGSLERSSSRAWMILPVVLVGMLPACQRPAADGGAQSERGDGDGDGSNEPSSADTDSDGDGDGDGLSFVPDTDADNQEHCDGYDPMCPEGEKCVPWRTNDFRAATCEPLIGDGATGEPCTIEDNQDTCDVDNLCLDWVETDDGFVGTCMPFCTNLGDWDYECPDGFQCIADGGFALCFEVCDPIVQDCDEGDGCYWGGSSLLCASGTSNIELGEPCGYINDCVAGTQCINADVLPDCEGSACCAQWCDLGQAICDQPGTECAPFFDAGQAPPELEHIGICIAPVP